MSWGESANKLPERLRVRHVKKFLDSVDSDTLYRKPCVSWEACDKALKM